MKPLTDFQLLVRALRASSLVPHPAFWDGTEVERRRLRNKLKAQRRRWRRG